MTPRLGPIVGLVVMVLAGGSLARATPTLRYEATRRGDLATTGNTLGLAGTAAGPSAADGAGVFTDATLALQVQGWAKGTTLDWTLASSDAVLDLPAGARVTYAELVWGGTVDASVVGSLDAPIALTAPSGAVYEVAPDPATSAPAGGSMRTDGYYGRSADVTALVEGAGTYRVGAVPSTLADGDAAAGWSLYVVYEADALPPRRLGVFTVMESVGGSWPLSAATGALDGVCVPTDAARRKARVVASAMEGDPGITGDTFRLERAENRLGDNAARITGLETSLTDVFGGHLTKDDGAIDTRGTWGQANHGAANVVAGARQGWDHVAMDGSAPLATNWSSAFFRPTAGSDRITFMAVALAIDLRTPLLDDTSPVMTALPDMPTVGDRVTLTVAVKNVGDATATGVVFTLPPLPAGVTYVPSSFATDGAPPLAGPVTSAAQLVSGVSIANVAAGETLVVTLVVEVVAATSGGSLAFAPTIVYANQPCPGAAVPDTFAPPALVVPIAVCGDGVVDRAEGCDDGDREARDGCSAACAVERGWRCETTGASGPSACTTSCGDGRLAAGVEACDDGDALSGDGCSAACTIEHGWLCEANPGAAGTPSSPDSRCATRCGDGAVGAPIEGCDDANARGGDGCSAACAVEPGWSCRENPDAQGTEAAPDTLCEARCGDGAVAAPVERCDDGDAAGGDGCSATCDVERGWACATAGLACAPIACGDGVRALGAEGCDDGNTTDGDGCSVACAVEPGWSCVDAAVDGDGAPDSTCAASCGDGALAPPVEGCDDANTRDGDGCSAACAVELGWDCVGAAGGASACAERCGDGRIVGAEVCDDGNVEPAAGADLDPDGCQADCRAVDHGWRCEGAPSVCATTCGDGVVGREVERCDDANTKDGDGCAADCAAVETGWSCGDPPADPSVCEPRCGDGLVRGVEGCDDANTADSDGCAADCREEPGWLCTESSSASASACVPDSDDDGVPDDGDGSGVVGDHLCAPGETAGCDDVCPDFANADQELPAAETPLCPPYRGPRIQGGGGGCAGGSADGALVVIALALVAALVGRRWRRPFDAALGVALVAGGAVALAPPLARGARAQQVDPHTLAPALAPTAILGVDTSAVPPHLAPWASLTLGVADDELATRTAPDLAVRGPLRGRTTLTLAGGLGLFDRLEVALGVPIVATRLGAVPVTPSVARDGGGLTALGSGATGLGDLRVALKARLLGPAFGRGEGLGLAVTADVTLPTGGSDAFMSEGDVTAEPRLVLDWRTSDGLALALDVGYLARSATRVDDLGIDDEVRLGLGAEVPVGFYGIAFLGEVDLAVGLGASAYDEGGVAARELGVEALGGLRWRAPTGLVVSAAAGSGLTAGYGAPDFRVLLGVSYGGPVPVASAEPMVPGATLARREGDWGRDAELAPPARPMEKLDAAAFDTLAANDPDADADGVPLPADQCPTEPEDLDGHMDSDGCPDPDDDGDQIPDTADKCRDTKEVFNGVDDADGCPDEGSSIVSQVGPQIVIAEKIRFKSGSAELLDSDKRVLDQVVGTLKAVTLGSRVRIEGHTDNLGDREFNVDLAERRAWSVLAYLVSQGVARERLFAKGFGSTRPVAGNGDDRGRAQNRRVEFHIVAPGEPDDGVAR